MAYKEKPWSVLWVNSDERPLPPDGPGWYVRDRHGNNIAHFYDGEAAYEYVEVMGE